MLVRLILKAELRVCLSFHKPFDAVRKGIVVSVSLAERLSHFPKALEQLRSLGLPFLKLLPPTPTPATISYPIAVGLED